MAGAGSSAAAHLGPAHASLDLGGDGIVFFDPFWFERPRLRRGPVGITIWLLFGSVDIDVSLGFDVDRRGSADPYRTATSRSAASGSRSRSATRAIRPTTRFGAAQFAAKYLRGDKRRTGRPGRRRSLGALTAGKSDAPNPAGSPSRPTAAPSTRSRVVPEFQLTLRDHRTGRDHRD